MNLQIPKFRGQRVTIFSIIQAYVVFFKTVQRILTKTLVLHL